MANWSEIGSTFGQNFVFGGILLGCLAVIIKFISTEIAGHLSGGLPVSLSFVIIMTYWITKDRKKTGKTALTAIAGGLMWCVYAFIIGMILLYTEWNFTVVFCCNLIVYLLLTGLVVYLLRDHYFPKEGAAANVAASKFVTTRLDK